jgi:hypothetical protein
MTDADLLTLDKMGFIPGPHEDEKIFLARVEKTKKNFEQGSWIPESHWDWVRQYLDLMYDVKPLYICAFYSNKGLAPWQGAAAWIEGKALNSIQLREGLRKGSYLGLYRREEILAHEAVHAARSGFNEDRFEEFFAYQTSEKKWRRVLGPLIQRPWEVWPFLVAIVLGALWPLFYLAASLWALAGFARLIQRHRQLKRASCQILDFVRDPRRTRAILLRLTDREIEFFAKGINFEKYAEEQTSLRWKVIRSYYG